MNLYLEKFLSAFGSMLDISPRPHKPIQSPPFERGIGRHFDEALGYIERAMKRYKTEDIQDVKKPSLPVD